MKYYELSNNLKNLEEVLNSELKFPVSVSLAMIKNKNTMNAEMESYGEAYNVIVKKYANGNSVIEKTDPNFNKVTEELTELNGQECDINVKKISVQSIENMEIPINMLNKIAFMIEEE